MWRFVRTPEGPPAHNGLQLGQILLGKVVRLLRTLYFATPTKPSQMTFWYWFAHHMQKRNGLPTGWALIAVLCNLSSRSMHITHTRQLCDVGYWEPEYIPMSSYFFIEVVIFISFSSDYVNSKILEKVWHWTLVSKNWSLWAGMSSVGKT